MFHQLPVARFSLLKFLLCLKALLHQPVDLGFDKPDGIKYLPAFGLTIKLGRFRRSPVRIPIDSGNIFEQGLGIMPGKGTIQKEKDGKLPSPEFGKESAERYV